MKLSLTQRTEIKLKSKETPAQYQNTLKNLKGKFDAQYTVTREL